MKRRSRAGLLLLAVPVVIALVAHAASLDGEFVADDEPDIVDHPVVSGQEPWYRVLDYDYMGAPIGTGANTVRPLATLLFASEWRVWGAEPVLFHALSLACFLVLVWLTTGLFRELIPKPYAVASAAVFAAMAIHVDAVGLIANRAEVLSLLLVVVSLRAALRDRMFWATVAYLAALLCKESAFLLPLLVLWHRVVFHGVGSLRLGRKGRGVLVLAAAGTLFLVLRSLLVSIDIGAYVLPADNMLQIQPLATRIWMPFALLGRYLSLTLLPVGLAFDHTYDAIPVGVDPADVHAWIGIVFSLVSLAGLVSWYRAEKRGQGEPLRPVAFAIGGFFISYALFSNSVFLIVTIFAERLFLAPSLWLALLGGAAAHLLVERHAAAKRWLLGVAGVLVAVQLGFSVNRSLDVRDDLSLFSAQVQAQPDSVKGRLYYAQSLAAHGDYDEAVWQLGVAMSGRNRFPERWSVPQIEGEVPIDERLQLLPGLLAPQAPRDRFWIEFRRAAVEWLGKRVAPVIDRASRAR